MRCYQLLVKYTEADAVRSRIVFASKQKRPLLMLPATKTFPMRAPVVPVSSTVSSLVMYPCGQSSERTCQHCWCDSHVRTHHRRPSGPCTCGKYSDSPPQLREAARTTKTTRLN